MRYSKYAKKFPDKKNTKTKADIIDSKTKTGDWVLMILKLSCFLMIVYFVKSFVDPKYSKQIINNYDKKEQIVPMGE